MAEAFLEHAGRMQQTIGNDGVEHSHASFVEDADDRLLVLELTGECFSELALLGADLHAPSTW